jgi:hypothetical protein
MATFGLIDYAAALPEVHASYHDIMATRHTDWINNFWKALAHDPVQFQRTWDSLKAIMAPGALDPLTKELIYVAVSATNEGRPPWWFLQWLLRTRHVLLFIAHKR